MFPCAKGTEEKDYGTPRRKERKEVHCISNLHQVARAEITAPKGVKNAKKYVGKKVVDKAHIE
jgi:hypothetical protein